MHSIQRSDVFYTKFLKNHSSLQNTMTHVGNKFSQERNIVVVIYIASMNNIVVEP